MIRNLYFAKRAPYYIFGLDYIQQSAGIRALHYLCHALNESGLEAYITCHGTVPHLRTPILSEEIMLRHHVTGRKPIMVYPEIVSGDPLATGGVVVRWLLNKPGLVGGDKFYSENDLIFTYDRNYLSDDMHGEILHIPTCDLSIFNNDANPHDNSRDLISFYAHKYLFSGAKLTKHVKDATSLGKEQKLTHQQIAAILRRSKCLYVYEQTALIAEALLCGCPVSVIETDYWRNSTANFTYTENFGVVMDDKPESLALAKANIQNYRIKYEGTVSDAWIYLDRFVELTQTASYPLMYK